MLKRCFLPLLCLILSLSGSERAYIYAKKCIEAELYPEAFEAIRDLPPSTAEEIAIYLESCRREHRWDLALAFIERQIDEGSQRSKESRFSTIDFVQEKSHIYMEKALFEGDFDTLIHLKKSSSLWPHDIQERVEEAARRQISAISSHLQKEEFQAAEKRCASFPWSHLDLQDPTPFQLYEAIFALNKKEYEKAETVLQKLASLPPCKADALFWLAKSMELSGKSREAVLKIRSELLELPENPYAVETTFCLFSWDEYLQGDKKALKQLKKFVKQYSMTPYTIVAFWLLGVDALHAREEESGKKIYSQDYEKALAYFESAENLYVELAKTGPIPPYFSQIAKEAQLDKIRLLLLIAKESSSSKRELYLTYAKESFDRVQSDYDPKKFFFLQSEFFDLMGDEKSAIDALTHIDGPLQTPLIQKKMAEFLYKNGQKEESLLLINALLCKPRELLPQEALIDLLLLKSHIFEEEKAWSEAILALSDVINQERGPDLKYRAMFHRAELYEKLERQDIAKKQYEACLSTTGEIYERALQKLKQL